MLTIVFLTSQLINSGPNRVILDICRHLDRTRYQPVIIALHPDDTARPIAEKFEELNCELVRFDFSKWQLELSTKRVAKHLEQYITEKYPDAVVHAHTYHPTLLARHISIPTCNTIHCIAAEDFPKRKGALMGKYMCFRYNQSLRRCRNIVAISDYMRSYYTRLGVNVEHIIHNGVDFKPKSITQNIRNELGLTDDTKLIVIAGGINTRKNNIHIVEELRTITDIPFKCVFLGIGHLLEQMRQLVKDDDRFEFVGYKNNVAEYLSAADLYLSSSLSEGLPLAVLEAACMGCPLLLSDIQAHSEIVKMIDLPAIRTYSLERGELQKAFIDFFNSSSISRETISEKAITLFSAENMSLKYQRLYADRIR